MPYVKRLGDDYVTNLLKSREPEPAAPSPAPQGYKPEPVTSTPSQPTYTYTPETFDTGKFTNAEIEEMWASPTPAPIPVQPLQAPQSPPTGPFRIDVSNPQNDSELLLRNILDTPVIGPALGGIGTGLNQLIGLAGEKLGIAAQNAAPAFEPIQQAVGPFAQSTAEKASQIPFISPLIGGIAQKVGEGLQGYAEHIGNPVAGLVGAETRENPVATALSSGLINIGTGNAKAVESLLFGRTTIPELLTSEGYNKAVAGEAAQSFTTDKAVIDLINSADLKFKTGDIKGAAADTWASVEAWGNGEFEDATPIQQLAWGMMYDPLNFVGLDALGGIGKAQKFLSAAEATQDITKSAETLKKAPLIAKVWDKITDALPKATGDTLLDPIKLGAAKPGEATRLRYFNPITAFRKTPVAKALNYVGRIQDYVLGFVKDETISREALRKVFEEYMPEAAKQHNISGMRGVMAEQGIVNSADFQRTVNSALDFHVSNDADGAYTIASQLRESLKQWGEATNPTLENLKETLFDSRPFKDIVDGLISKAEKGEELTRHQKYMNSYSGAFRRFQNTLDGFTSGKNNLDDIRNAVNQLDRDIENIGKLQLSAELTDHAQRIIVKTSQLPAAKMAEKFVNRIRPYEAVLFIATNPHAVAVNMIGNWVFSAIHGVNAWESADNIKSLFGRVYGAPDAKEIVGRVGDVIMAVTKDERYLNDVPLGGGKLPRVLASNPLSIAWKKAEEGANLRAFATGFRRAYQQVWKYGNEIPAMAPELENELRRTIGNKLFNRLTTAIEDSYNNTEMKNAVNDFFKAPRWQEYRKELAEKLSKRWSDRLGKPVTIPPELMDDMFSGGNSDRINKFLRHAAETVNLGGTPDAALMEELGRLKGEADKHLSSVKPGKGSEALNAVQKAEYDRLLKQGMDPKDAEIAARNVGKGSIPQPPDATGVRPPIEMPSTSEELKPMTTARANEILEKDPLFQDEELVKQTDDKYTRFGWFSKGRNRFSDEELYQQIDEYKKWIEEDMPQDLRDDYKKTLAAAEDELASRRVVRDAEIAGIDSANQVEPISEQLSESQSGFRKYLLDNLVTPNDIASWSPADFDQAMAGQFPKYKALADSYKGNKHPGPIQQMLKKAGMTDDQLNGLNRAKAIQKAAELNLPVKTDMRGKGFVPTEDDIINFARGKGIVVEGKEGKRVDQNLINVLHNWRPAGYGSPTKLVLAKDGQTSYRVLDRELLDKSPQSRQMMWNTLVDYIPRNKRTYSKPLTRGEFWEQFDLAFRNLTPEQDEMTRAVVDRWAYRIAKDKGWTMDETYANVFASVEPGKASGGALEQAEKLDPWYYSHLLKSVQNLPLEKMTAQQARAMLEKAGIKKDEWKWVGMDEFLEGKTKLTKQELLDHVRQNQVQIREVTRGGVVDLENPPTVYQGYTLPGGEEYRELELIWNRELPSRVYDAGGNWIGSGPETVPYAENHYNTPDQIAHIRFDTRIDKDGKKVLFVEEFQSDWSQKGRDRGFADPELRQQYEDAYAELANLADNDPDVIALRERMRVAEDDKSPDYYNLIDEHQAITQKKWPELSNRITDLASQIANSDVPRGPFVSNTQNWTDLALKRMTRYAAENGFDRIAWTTGQQQVERYNQLIRATADRIEVLPGLGEDTVGVVATYQGQNVLNETVPIGQLHEYVGRNNVENALAKTRNSESFVMEGENITIGDAGMKAYYDEIIPQSFNKLGKKWGVRSGVTNIPTKVEITPENQALAIRAFQAGEDSGIQRKIEQVHSLDITDQMRETVLREGFPLFQDEGIKKGSTDFLPDGRAIIRAVTDSHDVSTAIHEPLHAFLPFLPEDEKQVFNQFVNMQPGEFDALHKEYTTGNLKLSTTNGKKYRDAQEKVANAFVQYLHEGKAPIPELESLFKRFAQFLRDIYQKFVLPNKSIPITDEMRGMFDRVMSVTQKDLDEFVQSSPKPVAQAIPVDPGQPVQPGIKPPVQQVVPPTNVAPTDPNNPVAGLTPESLVDPEARLKIENQMVQDMMEELLPFMRQDGVMPMNPLPGHLKNQLYQWIDSKVSPRQRESIQAATAHGRWYQAHTVLNYNERTNLDDMLTFWAPFTFWPLHMATNITQEFIDRPALLNQYMRLRNSYEDWSNSQTAGMPERFKGRIKIPLPFLPDWMEGGVWVNPFRTLFPIEDVFKVDDLERAGYLANGPAQDENLDPPDPIGFMSDMFSPHLPIKLLMELYQGDQADVEDLLANLPPMRIAKAIDPNSFGAAVDPNFNIAGINPFRGRWDNYYVERALRDMLSEGLLGKTPEESERIFKKTLLERTGAVWREAQERARLQNYSASVVPGFTGFTGKVYTTGEQIYGQSRLERDRLLDELVKKHKGSQDMTYDQKFQYIMDKGEFNQGGAMQKLYATHPELEGSDIRSNRKREDDEQLYREFLRDAIWNKVTKAGELEQRIWRAQLGQEFDTYFYKKDTRNYDNITTATLAGWANAVKVGLPEVSESAGYEQPQPEPYKVNFPTQAQSDKYQAYKDQIEKAVGWDNYYALVEQYKQLKKTNETQVKLWLKTPEGKVLTSVWDYEDDFYQDNPDILKLLETSGAVEKKSNGDAAPSSDDQKGQAWFQGMLAAGYPDYETYQKEREEYFALPEKSQQRRDFLKTNPRLQRVFEISGAIYPKETEQESFNTRRGSGVKGSTGYDLTPNTSPVRFPRPSYNPKSNTLPKGLIWEILGPKLREFGAMPPGSPERQAMFESDPDLRHYFRMTPVPNMRLPYAEIIRGRLNYQQKPYTNFKKAKPGSAPTRKNINYS